VGRGGLDRGVEWAAYVDIARMERGVGMFVVLMLDVFYWIYDGFLL
jgi:hypothetical protein